MTPGRKKPWSWPGSSRPRRGPTADNIPGNPADAQDELDFRPGGGEISRGSFAPSGVDGTEELIEYRSVFWDIVPGTRIVFGYELVLDGVRRWVSLVTVELSVRSDAAGTRLRHTEQYVLLAYEGDGARDAAHLKGSTSLALNGLDAALGEERVSCRVEGG
jgi:uncharacterized protein YndB with AHSA1/START domain